MMKAEKIEEFVVDFKIQREWGWLVVTAFFLAGVGAGLYFIATVLEGWANLESRGLASLGVIVVALGTTTAFLLDLGRVERFWRVLARPLSSWISRGVFLMVGFVLFGALSLAPQWLRGLPWGGTGLAQAFQVLAMVAAFGLAIYSGFVLCYSPSIAFWNSTLLPVLFVLYAFLGGMAVIFAFLPAMGPAQPNIRMLETLEIWLIVSAMVLLSIYISTMAASTAGARQAVRELLRGELALEFVGGVIILGLLAPLGIALYVYFANWSLSAASPALIMAGILELAGGFLFRRAFIRAGIYAPLL